MEDFLGYNLSALARNFQKTNAHTTGRNSVVRPIDIGEDHFNCGLYRRVRIGDEVDSRIQYRLQLDLGLRLLHLRSVLQ